VLLSSAATCWHVCDKKISKKPVKCPQTLTHFGPKADKPSQREFNAKKKTKLSSKTETSKYIQIQIEIEIQVDVWTQIHMYTSTK